MGMSASEIITPLLGALQASLSVLLTIYVGVLIAQFQLLDSDAAKKVSRTSVRVFLPFLLITKVGNQLDLETGSRYIPIIVWALTYNLFSILVGVLATRFFKLPSWVTPALAFNNTTSLPLLLVGSLDATGILDALLIDSSDTTKDAIARAESYFLINAMISNTLTFSLGPRLLQPHEDDAPESWDKKQQENEGGEEVNSHIHPGGRGYPFAQWNAGGGENGNSGEAQSHEEAEAQSRGQTLQEFVDEETSLLPRTMIRRAQSAENDAEEKGEWFWSKLPGWAQTVLEILYAFVNPPLIGASLGALIGLVPALHTLFFSETNEGGYFNAWLTKPMSNVGSLFATLQIIVVGVKLSQSLRKLKKGEKSGKVPWASMGFITALRFFVWPLISIPVIWLLATRTSLLSADPVLWFAMMLMPTGPPAMVLVSLADVTGSDDEEKMAIAKFLTISYSITPLICFGVVGALKASQAAIAQ
ncbi:hypothetical protein MBLNU230_g1830t1 [Neophaeotheca triangularis]